TFLVARSLAPSGRANARSAVAGGRLASWSQSWTFGSPYVTRSQYLTEGLCHCNENRRSITHVKCRNERCGPMPTPEDENVQRVESLEQLRSRLEAESGDGLRLLENLEDNPICCVSFDTSIPCIRVVWKRYATSTQLRFIHERLLRMLVESRV